MLARWRGALQLRRFLLGRRWAYAAGAAGLLVGVAAAIAAPPVGAAGIGVALASAALGVATFVHDSRQIAREGSAMHVVHLGRQATAGLEPSDRYGGFQLADAGDDRALFSAEVNSLLGETATPLKAAPDPYRLSGPERDCAGFLLKEHFRRGAVLFNDRKVRLVTDITPEVLRAGRSITIQRTDYFSSLCTNEIARQEVRSRGSAHPILRGRDLFSSNGVLSDLEHSRCSDHIGVSTIAFTSDGHLVLATQASGSAQSPNLINASGSGSVDWRDYEQLEVPEFERLVRHAMERELAEEVGIEPSAVSTTELTGYARILGRGGKPELFGISLVDAPMADLGIRRNERLFIAEIAPLRLRRSSPGDLEAALDELERERGGSFALSLILGLEFVRGRLRSKPDRTMELIRGEAP